MKNLMVFAVRGGTLALAFVAAAASGQSDADILSSVRACSSIEDDAQRLACFDASLGTDSSRGELVERAVETDLETALSEVEAVAEERPVRIVEIRRNDFGVTTFLAENGEAWVQRSGAQGRFPPPPFDTVLQPALGDSFFLLSPLGGPRARVQPVR